MGDDPPEQRVGGGCLLVGMGVERVAGELGEVLDIGSRDGPRSSGDGVADLQLGERLAERVHGASHYLPTNRSVNHRMWPWPKEVRRRRFS